MLPGYKACPNCGTGVDIAAQFCPRCGHQYRTQFQAPPNQTQAFYSPPSPPPGYPGHGQQPPVDAIFVPPGTHSVPLAILVSLFCCAPFGMLYNRQYFKAVVCILVAMVAGVITGGVAAIVTWPVFVIDAGCIATKLNRGQPVRPWEFF